ncbi:asparagine synthase (glutamine-hydrolyzing) [Fluviispira multicolorata]|uniref:asparagine synthase (glutamine-hydrolyzing) n=1 Tax=Fluviispira multicolorata TaxID=2654512 RepID=A0A833JD04_9BACT|nr:asparagine synthase (glutamine-hydrolyzing) [Fluviispira multicolorata]KAB8028048.1 asparagine synthase (glutamine-hydrolyzing) [Fluviispira multicolorata]
MCGIFGVISRPNQFQHKDVLNALNKLSHRGPNDWGLEKFIIQGKWDVWLGQRRLSIIDLTLTGHQPMTFLAPNGIHQSLVFNGEIYNYQDLKKEFKLNWNFKSSSDTEVLLAGLHFQGAKFLKKINGMLAMAFLDLNAQNILFARDRVGKKPLYIYNSNDLIIFSSELKSIVSLGVELTINEESLAYFHFLGYVPAHLSIYKECFKVKAASYINVDLSNEKLKLTNQIQYWDPLKSYAKVYSGTYENAIDEFLELLDDATRIRLISDVPVGTFLSGGIDSSLVLSSLKNLKSKNIKAFTVKFSDKNFDESEVARKTAFMLDYPLETLHLKECDYNNQIDKISFHYDEPFSDSSQIPTLAISQAAQKYVTVVLTGDGGDEVFIGYPRFSYLKKISRINNFFKYIPVSNKLMLNFLNSSYGKYLFKRFLNFLSINSNNIDSKIQKVNELISANSYKEIYDTILCTNSKNLLSDKDRTLVNYFNNYYDTVKNWYPDYSWEALRSRSIEENLAALDFVSYMRDDVLVKVDRATMAYSLEARSPLLDYRVIEFGHSLPLKYKFKNGIHKRILRDALSRRVNSELASLPKMGFGVPLPSNLPAGANLISRWNIFIENEWKKNFIKNS